MMIHGMRLVSFVLNCKKDQAHQKGQMMARSLFIILLYTLHGLWASGYSRVDPSPKRGVVVRQMMHRLPRSPGRLARLQYDAHRTRRDAWRLLSGCQSDQTLTPRPYLSTKRTTVGIVFRYKTVLISRRAPLPHSVLRSRHRCGQIRVQRRQIIIGQFNGNAKGHL